MAPSDRLRSGAPRPASDAANLVLKGTRLDGTLHFTAQTVVSGEIAGEITCGGTLFIEVGARVTGRVQAPTIVIYGELDGTALATEFMEICTGAAVSGIVRAKSIRVDQGANLTADLSISADATMPAAPAPAAPPAPSVPA
ncbi:MAG: polymer-forming cytoskeletal protein [Hyphomonas sp.]|nr:polymer-forming cytoskeletal protein [Hyphomonas sp.]